MDETQLFSFLLRVWRAGDGNQPDWRASVEDIRTGERRGFASLEELCVFILKLPGTTAGKPETRKEKK